MSGAPLTLAGAQRAAVDPVASVWLSASAGTGKTQVLTARVLRLLLAGVRPEAILALTFTRAGATEMAVRINATLARWVRAEATALDAELDAMGAAGGPEARARARRLFAAVLDCPGGGLRIDTIHAFAQWLLGAFPAEAGLAPSTRAMEEHEKRLLARETLAQLLTDLAARGETRLLDALGTLSLRLGEGAAEAYLMQCASAEAWQAAGWAQGPLDAPVRRLLGLAADATASSVAALCADHALDRLAIERVRHAYRTWDTSTAHKALDAIARWLEGDAAARLAGLDELLDALLTKALQPPEPVRKAFLKQDPSAAEALDTLAAALIGIAERRVLVVLADWLTPVLELGRAFAHAWAAAKLREGLIDFDDQIAHAAALLSRGDMAEWICYKLDRRFDHILVDEAQDTNAAQWRIIFALTGEFYAGEGAAGDRSRSLFVVGDHKQAIFGFQGTSPENFARALVELRRRMASAAQAPTAPHLAELGLAQSFRSASPILAVVDRAITAIGPGRLGLPADARVRHLGQDRPGVVALWRPVGAVGRAEEGGEGDPADDDAGPDWLSAPERRLAETIARQVKHWHDHGYPLRKGVMPGQPSRRGGAGDVLVLVRRRGALAALIVARLAALGVPVAGVDRLRLGAPLAVKDLLAALRFAAQPLDDLNLANLLVSPLIGWTQAQLLAHGYRPRGTALWQHLRASTHPQVAACLGRLGQLLARADFEPVHMLLDWLLVGPWQARAALVSRLGQAAHDPLDELLNAAHAYAASATASIVGFLAWFDAGEGELKREAGRAEGMVRVMTVHAAKGLQAPIVILADACARRDAMRRGGPTLVDPASVIGGGEPVRMPLPALPKDQRVGALAAAAAAEAAAEAEEHWRLLYVAMTRAEEALFITGALGAREKEPHPDSWFARLAGLWRAEEWREDPLWGARLEHGAAPPTGGWAAEPIPLPMRPALPGWLTRAAPEEPRPPRPLAPSRIAEPVGPEPPLAARHFAAEAARRGTLIHRLLELLPDIPAAARDGVARRWLARHAGQFPPEARDDMARAVLSTLDDPRWAEVFGPSSLAEVPIAATLGGRVIAGTIDRLCIGPDRLILIDFKTTHRPPGALAEVPGASLRQLAAYELALAATFPGRAIAAGLLYTHAPRLIAVPPEALAGHKQALLAGQQSLPA